MSIDIGAAAVEEAVQDDGLGNVVPTPIVIRLVRSLGPWVIRRLESRAFMHKLVNSDTMTFPVPTNDEYLLLLRKNLMTRTSMKRIDAEMLIMKLIIRILEFSGYHVNLKEGRFGVLLYVTSIRFTR